MAKVAQVKLPKARKHTKPVKPTAKTQSRGAVPVARANTKQALLLDLLKRKGGATIEEASKATGWQSHSVRGVLSGTFKKKMGLKITSARVDGVRHYRIEA